MYEGTVLLLTIELTVTVLQAVSLLHVASGGIIKAIPLFATAFHPEVDIKGTDLIGAIVASDGMGVDVIVCVGEGWIIVGTS